MASWPEIKAGIFAGESGGDYNALFGFSNRPGGKFAGTNLTGMTVDEAINFANPRGPYAQWVKNQIGRVATPMGGFQVVGSTLKQAKEWAGLRGDEIMTPEIQDRIGQAILAKQGTDAWEGYRGPRTPGTTLTATQQQPPQALSGIGSPTLYPEGGPEESEVAEAEKPAEEKPKTWRESLTQDLAKDEDKGVLSSLAAAQAKKRQADAEAYASFSNIQTGGLDVNNAQNFAAAQALMASLLQNKKKVPGTSMTGMKGFI